MNHRMKSAYDTIETPDLLPKTVDRAIFCAMRKKTRNYIRKCLGSTIAVFCLIFIVILNISQNFASAVYDLPVLGPLSRVFTFIDYGVEDEHKIINVSIPNLEYTGDSELENRINLEIRTTIFDAVQQAEQRAEEYYNVYISTGGDPSEFIPIEVDVNYEVKYSSDKFLSFVISKWETQASAYTEQYFYNIDLQNGDVITLKDWFGPHYKQIVVDSIQQQIDAMDEEQQFYIFEDVSLESLINSDRHFYIDSDGKTIVVVFDKYEIAAGAIGILEFPIQPVS